MKNFIGIDLGTTNSAICSYDGTETKIWKSPEQNDVTPSAIYFDRRGNKYVGKRAYDTAPYSPDNSAMLFKRLMGTSTPIKFAAAKLTWTPEECSAEVLKVLFGYLPEEIRNDPETGTVITVPAAFNQMQKDATMKAASLAGLGKVALMQEPVAAVMSVMKTRDKDGIFLIFDLGGGTLDVAIAESLGGRVNLLAHGGIAMCGGRDFDRALVDNVVRPWLEENFALPENFVVDPAFKSLMRLASWATERAKIELSARESAVISLSESEARVRDLDGNEIYLDIPIDRETYNKLIEDRIMEAVNAARETLAKVGLTPHDLEKMVFVGGPTNYKPLRDKVSFELGIPGDTDVNPMTAVSEGASLFAESIDWTTQSRSRKTNRGQMSSGGQLAISFNYIARTPDVKAKIAIKMATAPEPGTEFQIDSVDTGWTSGRMALKKGMMLDVALTKSGDNTFKVFVFDPLGGPITLENDRIVITRTAATVDAIPASYSVGVEVLERLGGKPVLDYLVRAGDMLPKKGKKIFKAAESLKAGSHSSINLKLWEGEIEDPITDNRPIGVLKIAGTDFDDGVIPAGADLECEYEIQDSGNILLEVSVPSIGGVFSPGHNFYSRQEGQLDFTEAAAVVAKEGANTAARVEELQEVIDAPELDQARRKLEAAVNLDGDSGETEKTQEAMEGVYEAKKLLAQVRKGHLKEIREIELKKAQERFELVREFARPTEIQTYETLVANARRAIEHNDSDFDSYLSEIQSQGFQIVWRQDWFVINLFKDLVKAPESFSDKHQFQELVQMGLQCVKTDEIDKLRAIVAQLVSIQIHTGSESQMFDVANILRG